MVVMVTVWLSWYRLPWLPVVSEYDPGAHSVQFVDAVLLFVEEPAEQGEHTGEPALSA